MNYKTVGAVALPWVAGPGGGRDETGFGICSNLTSCTRILPHVSEFLRSLGSVRVAFLQLG